VSGATVGMAGWKYYGREETASPRLDRGAVLHRRHASVDRWYGRPGENATALFMDPSTGMRSINEIDQIAQFEYASAYTSEAIKRVLFGLRPGMKEVEVVSELMRPTGAPLNCHIMFNTGPDARFGLNSPRRPRHRPRRVL